MGPSMGQSRGLGLDEQSRTKTSSPTDVNHMNITEGKGGGKSCEKSGPPGYAQQSPQQWATSMLTKAMGTGGGGGKSGEHQGGQSNTPQRKGVTQSSVQGEG